MSMFIIYFLHQANHYGTYALRWALMPVILARVLQSDPAEQQPAEQEIEQKLMRTLKQFVNKSFEIFETLSRDEQGWNQGQEHVENRIASTGSIDFARILIGQLRQCVKSVMVRSIECSVPGALLSLIIYIYMNHILQVAHTENLSLRKALLSSRPRAEVMHVIVQVTYGCANK